MDRLLKNARSHHQCHFNLSVDLLKMRFPRTPSLAKCWALVLCISLFSWTSLATNVFQESQLVDRASNGQKYLLGVGKGDITGCV